MNRRSFLQAAVAGALAPACASRPFSAPVTHELVAAAGRVPIVGAPHPPTDVWCYDGRVPGPILRVRRGEPVRIAVRNHLAETTTVHWHGVRVPNAMDGVPHLTQPPIATNGGTFTYAFAPPDAGTYWYHPHSRSYEQVDRGLHGVLVVEEPDAPPVDRDEVWVLDDWRLQRDASIRDDYLHPRDLAHEGRVGNTVTLNGVVPELFEVRAGERIRLRLVNVANARIFGLQFLGHRPVVIALDGHPVAPHVPVGGTVVVGSAQRVDLILDASGRPGSKHLVRDVFYPREAYRFIELAYRDEAPLPPRGPVRAAAPNALPDADLDKAHVHEIRISGGAGGGELPAQSAQERQARRKRRAAGAKEAEPLWALNGVAIVGEHLHAPMLSFRRGASVVLRFVNDTAWPHPMHLHGHAFRVLSRNGKPNAIAEWRDTILIDASETTDVAFVADNPGDWMLHCHILEHQAAGMMASLRVE